MTEEQYPSIESLLPHCGPAILLSRVLSQSEEESVCEALVDQGCQYLNAGAAPSVLALEWGAQAVSVHLALASSAGLARKAGVLASVPKMSFFGGDFEAGTVALVSVKTDFWEGGRGRFEVRVTASGQLRAEGVVVIVES